MSVTTGGRISWSTPWGSGKRWRSRATERLDATENRILSIDNWLFRGRDGIEIERELPTLFTFRDGLIVRVDGFTDRAEALKAAGLSE